MICIPYPSFCLFHEKVGVYFYSEKPSKNYTYIFKIPYSPKHYRSRLYFNNSNNTGLLILDIVFLRIITLVRNIVAALKSIRVMLTNLAFNLIFYCRECHFFTKKNLFSYLIWENHLQTLCAYEL